MYRAPSASTTPLDRPAAAGARRARSGMARIRRRSPWRFHRNLMPLARRRQDFLGARALSSRLEGGMHNTKTRALHWPIIALLGCAAVGTWGVVRARGDATERFLYVWAGDQARIAPDFLAVVDFDPASPTYGNVQATRPLPGPGASGNEPHHVGLSRGGRTLALGWLLSVLKGQNEIFFFDVSNPASPQFLSAADPPQSAITDEFYALPEGGFLVTMMGSAGGHHPGRVVELDRRGRIVAEHPGTPPDDGFNPHGISVRPELNLMLTSDFICPSTTLNAMPGSLDLRGSIRVWKFRQREIVKTIEIPGAGGTIDVKLIPGDK